MANTVIQLRNSTVTGNVPSSLANGEISINSRDGKFFYSTPAGAVITHYPYLGPAGLNKEIQFNDSGTLGSNSGLTFDKATGTFTTSIVAATNNGNGTNFKVGDDAWIGDVNAADTIRIAGQQNVNNAYIQFGASNANTLGRAGTGPLTYTGAFTATGILSGSEINSTLSSGDEGGQINLALAATNTSLSGSVAIDIFQNRLRIFETSGTNRGVYIDMANGATTGVGTNLLSPSSSTDGWARNQANAAFLQANTPSSTANSAASYANSAFVTANSAASYANSAFATANSAGSYANSAFAAANAATATDTTQNNSITAAFASANAAFLAANTPSYVANSAAIYANAAFTRANNSLNANTGGSITGDISITGNLTVTGNTTYTNTVTVLIGDNIIVLNADIPQSAQPTENAGIEIDRGIQPNSSFLWIETSGKWAANNGNASIFIAADSAETYANAAFLAANSANATDLTQNNSITAAFASANAAFLQANTPSYVANSAAIYANGAFAAANAATATDTTQNNSITAAFASANAAFLQANTPSYTANSASAYANGAFAQANAAFTVANSAFTSANGTIAWNSANASFLQANAVFTVANNAVTSTNGSIIWATANSAATYANGAFAAANAATATDTTQNNSITAAFNTANASFTVANNAVTSANGTIIWNTANAAFLQANTPDYVANSAASYANSAFLKANSAFIRANNSLDANNGGTIAGQIAVDGGVYGNVTISQFASVWGQAYGPNAYSIVQVKSNDFASGIGMQAYASSNGMLYANTGIQFKTGATLRDKDYTTGGINAGQFAANGAFIAQAALASTSNATGSIQVVGGIGVKGNVSANGIIFDDGTRQTTAASGGATLGDVLALSIALG